MAAGEVGPPPILGLVGTEAKGELPWGWWLA